MDRSRILVCAVIVVLALPACDRNRQAEQPASSAPATTERENPAAPAKTVRRQRTPEEVVEAFGRQLKLVPTTAAPEIAGAAIREHYAALVDPQLLRAWIAAPETAPGRPVSSPWPERLEVQSSSRSKSAVLVEALVVEATSTGESGRVPVHVRLENEGGEWRIASYEAERPSDASNPAESSDAQDAAEVVRDYYRAIGAKDFDRAFAFWGPAGPPGQTRAEFARGFEQTASVEVTTGKPSRVDAAAGSRYITVPVTITATTTSGLRQHFAGTYVLRRAVVDGATEAQRRWHFERASIRELSGPA